MLIAKVLIVFLFIVLRFLENALLYDVIIIGGELCSPFSMLKKSYSYGCR